MKTLQQQQELYADLIVRIGINLQPGQSLRVGAELAHAEFARLIAVKAYQAGARYVQMDWKDVPSDKARMLYGKADDIEFVPSYEVARAQEMVDDTWARISLTGDEFPDMLNDVDPTIMRAMMTARMRKLKFYVEAQMAMKMQWCVAAVPTAAWAHKLFPNLNSKAAIRKLWQVILKMVRIDQANPVKAWRQHVSNLNQVVQSLAVNEIKTVRFLDSHLVDGKPATDLSVGLTAASFWQAGSAFRPDGLEFLPNMPTEEVFATPHNLHTEGWVRTSKPCFPLQRLVEKAWFRFKQGDVVDFKAETGQDVLEQLFEINGAKRLGEVALVDVRSPVNRSGLIFFDTLFDENAACHIAFGRAYSDIVTGADAMTEQERAAFGINLADTHVDTMIGTPTMSVIGLTASGKEVKIMQEGKFSKAVLAGK